MQKNQNHGHDMLLVMVECMKREIQSDINYISLSLRMAISKTMKGAKLNSHKKAIRMKANCPKLRKIKTEILLL